MERLSSGIVLVKLKTSKGLVGLERGESGIVDKGEIEAMKLGENEIDCEGTGTRDSSAESRSKTLL